jgi:hypothetical protein
MPGYAYSLPAKECATGSRLRNIEGSTCASCYALKGRYAFGNVQAALYRRLESLDSPLWVEVMSELIARKGGQWFRWHDSGDIQSVAHLAAICDVASLTPDVAHWLPTREYRMVTEYVSKGGRIPPNLNIRLSAHMIGGHVPSFPRLKGLVTVSTVSENGLGGHECPSRFQANSCGDCRACWDTNVPHVDYHKH